MEIKSKRTPKGPFWLNLMRLAYLREFYGEIRGSIGYVPGDLYHIWHGDIEKRQYLKRIKDFTPKNKRFHTKDKTDSEKR